MEKLERFDQFFCTIAQETGGIQGLFESMFNFLYKRTDFFYESDPGDKMGFPPGMNTKILFETFQKYQSEHYKKIPKKDVQEYNLKLQKYKQQLQQSEEEQRKLNEVNEQKKQQILAQDKPYFQQALSQQQSSQQPENTIQKQNENYENQSAQQAQKISDISTYNGGENDKYKWAQSITDVTVQINLPSNTKGKDLKVTIQSQWIQIMLKNSILIQGDLCDKIKVDESFWNIEDGMLLIMTLEKLNENIWKTILKGDQEIDTSKVDNSKNIHQFDDETQGALRKIMYEQDRKMKGLPTSEEEQQQELLRKAWDAEGSPFKGTPFDPKAFNQGNNSFNPQ